MGYPQKYPHAHINKLLEIWLFGIEGQSGLKKYIVNIQMIYEITGMIKPFPYPHGKMCRLKEHRTKNINTAIYKIQIN